MPYQNPLFCWTAKERERIINFIFNEMKSRLSTLAVTSACKIWDAVPDQMSEDTLKHMGELVAECAADSARLGISATLETFEASLRQRLTAEKN